MQAYGSGTVRPLQAALCQSWCPSSVPTVCSCLNRNILIVSRSPRMCTTNAVNFPRITCSVEWTINWWQRKIWITYVTSPKLWPFVRELLPNQLRFSLFVKMGFAPEVQVEGARESDRSKEKNGFVAGKHINKESKWWFQRSKKDWTAWFDFFCVMHSTVFIFWKYTRPSWLWATKVLKLLLSGNFDQG